jgi:hypothetical protein
MMDDNEFGLKITDEHKNLIFDNNSYDIKMIKKGIKIALNHLVERDKYYETWYLPEIEYELERLLKKDDYNY